MLFLIMPLFIKKEISEKLSKKRDAKCGKYPPDSPDLNKVENWWAVLKMWMIQRLKEFETVRECVDAAFKYCPNFFA